MVLQSLGWVINPYLFVQQYKIISFIHYWPSKFFAASCINLFYQQFLWRRACTMLFALEQKSFLPIGCCKKLRNPHSKHGRQIVSTKPLFRKICTLCTIFFDIRLFKQESACAVQEFLNQIDFCTQQLRFLKITKIDIKKITFS